MSRCWPFLVSSLLLLGCGGERSDRDDGGEGAGGDVDCEPLVEASELGDPVVVRDDLDHFFGRPFPDDRRRRGDGTIDLDGFPNPTEATILANYLDVIGPNTGGFSTNPVIYFAFSGPLHPDTLPAEDAPAESLSEDAAVYLVNVDDDSPARGERVPMRVRFVEDAGIYAPANLLQAHPVLGFPLDSDATYAAVVTSRVRDAACRALAAGPSEQLARLADHDLDPHSAVAAAVFTTQPILEPMEQLREAVLSRPDPLLRNVRHLSTESQFVLYEATVEIPIYQAGTPPYLAPADGGGIVFGDDGLPSVQRTEDVRVAITIPRRSMPRSGWPLVLYGHGTGGDYVTFARNGVADELARRGLAVMGHDLPHHGARNPTNTAPELTFVNLNNIVAFRDNLRQGAADHFTLVRLARAGVSIRQDVTADGQPAFTDPQRILYLGHSQGGLTGAPFVAVEGDILGAALSGTGGVLRVTILDRRDYIDFNLLARQLLDINDRPEYDSELDLFHPVPMIFQTFADPADPVNYAPHFFSRTDYKWPTPTALLQGQLDEATPVRSSDAFVAAAEGPPVTPAGWAIDAFELKGIEETPPPIRGNINDVTGVTLQYPQDGHFALFDNENAAKRTYDFLETAAEGDAAVAR